jgi:hypothetical protein
MPLSKTLEMENNYFECKKVQYASEEYALFDVRRIRKISERSKMPVRAYLCFCGSWHLTSRADKKDEVISELKIKNNELENQIKELTNLGKSNAEERLALRTNKIIIELRKGMETCRERNKALLKNNNDLITQLVQLKNNSITE